MNTMILPINIDELINGRTIEWERLEFKAGWNPEAVLHTACAFANDVNNLGGGYIVIGVDEHDGKPRFPPVGISDTQVDTIQKKIVELGHRIVPDYFPLVFPAVVQGRRILVLWRPGGQTRPYKAPVSLTEKSGHAFYVRRSSTTVRATGDAERHLFQLAAKVPFDDRVNMHARLADLDLGTIRSFLQETGSGLFASAAETPFEELCRQMQIAREYGEQILPLNVGVLLFSAHPEKHFRGAVIEVVEYQDDVGDHFTEKKFTGPVHVQLRNALSYIKTRVVKEFVRKVPGQAEANRFYNYPYEAVEEVLANAACHRGYDHESSIEVNVRLDRIEVLSFPGPIPPVDNAILREPRIIAREYRNRRIGDFLKELDLTEGRGTGIPKIRRAMKANGSPPPQFETDADRTHFLATLLIHPMVESARETVTFDPSQNGDATDLLPLVLVGRGSFSRLDYESVTGLSKRHSARRLASLIERGILAKTGRGSSVRYQVCATPSNASGSEKD